MSDKETSVFLPHVGWLDFAKKDHIANFLRQTWYKYKEQAFFRLYIHKTDVVIDCGAHVGLFSVLAGSILKDTGRLIAIEPNPSTLKFLRYNLLTHGLTKTNVIEGVVADRQGQRNFYARDGEFSASSSLYTNKNVSTPVRTKVHTLDALIAGQNISKGCPVEN